MVALSFDSEDLSVDQQLDSVTLVPIHFIFCKLNILLLHQHCSNVWMGQPVPLIS
jgi:hypothetical protein